MRNNNYSENELKLMLKAIWNPVNDTGDVKILNSSVSKGAPKHHFNLSLNGQNYYIKRFYYNNIKSILKNACRSSRAKKFYLLAFEISQKGFDIPEAVCYLDKKFLCFTLGCIVITKEISNISPFKQHFELVFNNDPQKTTSYLKELADFLYQLNTKKIVHADLLGNILIEETAEKFKIHMIDLDAIKAIGFITKFDKIKHFEGFYDYFVKNKALDAPSWDKLCEEYFKLDSTSFKNAEALTLQVKNRKKLLYYITHYK